LLRKKQTQYFHYVLVLYNVFFLAEHNRVVASSVDNRGAIMLC
jgi:hypothetical protein